MRPAPRRRPRAAGTARRPPAAFAAWCSTVPIDRAGHTYGKSYRDVVRAVHGELPHPPDVVAFPPTEADVVALLDWCASPASRRSPTAAGRRWSAASSAPSATRFAGVVSIDLGRLDRVLEIDTVSRAARIQAGALGPVLEDQLRPHGYTLRHFPQSFEFSTLGGWLATRSGGHYASVYTHIDDLVESMRVVTPTGVSESRRLPGSGAGPSPDRLFLGSEGTRHHHRGVDAGAGPPRCRASAGVVFGDYATGWRRPGRSPSPGCSRPTAGCSTAEAATAAGADVGALLVLGFESADHPVDPWIDRAVELCRDHGGDVPAGVRTSDSADSATRGATTPSGRGDVVPAGAVRARRPGPCGMLLETFETACTWDGFAALHAAVTTAVTDALQRICGGGWVTCRFTHVYPDGPAPYFSVTAPGRSARSWRCGTRSRRPRPRRCSPPAARSPTTTPSAATTTLVRRQRPEPFGRALAAAKAQLDPAGILNPGVIV